VNAENQIKELKYEYGMEEFCSESLAATEQAFRMGDGGLQPDEPLQTEGYGREIIPKAGHYEVKMYCIRKLHRTQRLFNNLENRSHGPKTGQYRRALRQVGTS
jgi:hypothetical protein